jgi:hypothetical protein
LKAVNLQVVRYLDRVFPIRKGGLTSALSFQKLATPLPMFPHKPTILIKTVPDPWQGRKMDSSIVLNIGGCLFGGSRFFIGRARLSLLRQNLFTCFVCSGRSHIRIQIAPDCLDTQRRHQALRSDELFFRLPTRW